MNTDTPQTQLRRRTLIIMRVNEKAEDLYEDALELGTIAARAFDEQHGGERQKHRAQLTGLENIADTTLKFTDVLDYIKRQIARPQGQGWRKKYVGKDGGEYKPFGESLKNYIEGRLRNEADQICSELKIGETPEDKRDHQLVYLQLIRQFVRQIVVQYEYRINTPPSSPTPNKPSQGARP